MTDATYFFGGWGPVVRILVVGALMYAALVALLRVSGSRTLASMEAFDFVVTIAIGSAFGRALTARDVALAEAVAAFALLIALQYVVARVRAKSPRFLNAVSSPPALLYLKGDYLREAMRRNRVTESDLRSAVREKRFGSMDEVEAIVLESSGTLSVIGALRDASALGEDLAHQARDTRLRDEE